MIAPADRSVIVVSHKRPTYLARCLAMLRDHDCADVIVVTDAASRKVVPPDCKVAPFEGRNISEARNLGVAVAHTPVLAFIDDDARPEPGWLDALTAPLADPDISATTGWVRTGDTARWQFQGEWVTPLAEMQHLPALAGVTVYDPRPDGAVLGLIGTNFALRRQAYDRIGGFDPGFRYYLEDADVSMRLAQAGLGRMAVVSDAQQRHDRAAGPYRDEQHRIRDHTEIGASLCRLLDKHAPASARSAAWDKAEQRQLQSVELGLIRGDLEPQDLFRARLQMRQGAVLAANRP